MSEGLSDAPLSALMSLSVQLHILLSLSLCFFLFLSDSDPPKGTVSTDPRYISYRTSNKLLTSMLSISLSLFLVLSPLLFNKRAEFSGQNVLSSRARSHSDCAQKILMTSSSVTD